MTSVRGSPPLASVRGRGLRRRARAEVHPQSGLASNGRAGGHRPAPSACYLLRCSSARRSASSAAPSRSGAEAAVPEAGMLSRCARTRRVRRGRGRSEAAGARAPAPASVEAPSAWRSVERTAPTGKRAIRLTGAGGRAHSRGGTRTHDHAGWRAGGWAGRRHLLCPRCWWPGARAGKRGPPRRAPLSPPDLGHLRRTWSARGPPPPPLLRLGKLRLLEPLGHVEAVSWASITSWTLVTASIVELRLDLLAQRVMRLEDGARTRGLGH